MTARSFAKVLFLRIAAVFATASAFAATEITFISESSAGSGYGRWDTPVTYASEWASFENNTYTPTNILWSGDTGYVTAIVRFRGEGDAALDGAHSLFRIADCRDRPVFMVWSGSGWIPARTDAFVPAYDREYEVKFTLDLGLQTYSVAVDGKTLSAVDGGATRFSFAGTPHSVSKVAFGGTTEFKSLTGECTANCSWTGAGANGYWTTGANWLSGAAPVAEKSSGGLLIGCLAA